METVTNAVSGAATAASKLIWGEGDQAEKTTTTNETGGVEPISGEQGKGTVNEPFDKGNSETPTTGEHYLASSNNGPHTTHTANMLDPRAHQESANDRLAKTNIAHANPIPSSNEGGSYSTSTADATTQPSSNTTTLPDRTRAMHDDPNLIEPRPSIPAINPVSESSTNLSVLPSSGISSTSHQGAANPTDEPSTGMSKLNIDDIDGEEALKKKDPNDHSGEPMHIHGGAEPTSSKLESRNESTLGQAGGQELGKEEHGTGAQYVQTSGLAAEGGDFDATKPGAGREADRLMEQKGVGKTKPGESDETSPSPSGGKEKVKLTDKIKNKLHIHHKDKS